MIQYVGREFPSMNTIDCNCQEITDEECDDCEEGSDADKLKFLNYLKNDYMICWSLGKDSYERAFVITAVCSPETCDPADYKELK